MQLVLDRCFVSCPPGAFSATHYQRIACLPFVCLPPLHSRAQFLDSPLRRDSASEKLAVSSASKPDRRSSVRLRVCVRESACVCEEPQRNACHRCGGQNNLLSSPFALSVSLLTTWTALAEPNFFQLRRVEPSMSTVTTRERKHRFGHVCGWLQGGCMDSPRLYATCPELCLLSASQIRRWGQQQSQGSKALLARRLLLASPPSRGGLPRACPPTQGCFCCTGFRCLQPGAE